MKQWISIVVVPERRQSSQAHLTTRFSNLREFKCGTGPANPCGRRFKYYFPSKISMDVVFTSLERAFYVRVTLAVFNPEPRLDSRYKSTPQCFRDLASTAKFRWQDCDAACRTRPACDPGIGTYNEVRHPPRSGWLDELGRLKGGWSVGLGVAQCAPYWLVQNCPAPSAASCSRMYVQTCSSSDSTIDTA